MAIVALTPFPITSAALCSFADPDYKERRYREGIPYCKRNVSLARKKIVYRRYHFNHRKNSSFTVDHVLPLSLGGNNSVGNLFLEWKGLRDHRYPLEQHLYWAIRAGCLSQVSAIKVILDSKYNPTFLNEKSYKEWGSLENYISVKHIKIWKEWACINLIDKDKGQN